MTCCGKVNEGVKAPALHALQLQARAKCAGQTPARALQLSEPLQTPQSGCAGLIARVLSSIFA
jgi:hypothetical protein